MSCKPPTTLRTRTRKAIYGAKVQQLFDITKYSDKKTTKYNKRERNLKKTHHFLNKKHYGGGNLLIINVIKKGNYIHVDTATKNNENYFNQHKQLQTYNIPKHPIRPRGSSGTPPLANIASGRKKKGL